MPWKNGGGETIEIAISPAGASLDGFDWRVSMAHVATPGPFSIFAGIDRTLAVLRGSGLVLRIAGRGEIRLGPDAAPFAFPGDLPVDAALLDGAIDDLNVMTRRGRYRHTLSRVRLDRPAVLPQYGDTMIVLARSGDTRMRTRGGEERLRRDDAVILEGAEGTSLEIAPDDSAELFIIDLWRSTSDLPKR